MKPSSPRGTPPEPGKRRAASRPQVMDDYTGRLLYLAHERAHQSAQAVLPTDHSPKDFSVLATIAGHGPLSQHDLATVLDLNRTVMVHLIDDLEAKGFVRRDRNPNDRRSYALSLTADGKRILRALTTALNRGERLLMADVSADDADRLGEHLRRLMPDPDNPGPRELSRRVGYLIARTHLHLRSMAESGLAGSGLQMRHFAVLQHLRSLQPCSQQDLARAMGVSAPMVLEVIEPMEAKGYVERLRSATDRRAYELRLTAAGAAWLEEGWRSVDVVQDYVESRLGKRGTADLNAILRQVVGGAASLVTYPRSRVSSPQRVDGDE